MAVRTFEMVRIEDESGVSGVGKVLEGVIFSDGTCVTRWTSDKSPGRSTNIWDSLGSFIAVHIAPHPDNKSRLMFSDGEVYEHTERTKAGRTGSVESVPGVPKRRRKRKTVVPGMGEQQVSAPVATGNTNPKPEEVLGPEIKKD